MSSYNVTFQLVDSPIDESKPGGTIPGDKLREAFREFPFEAQVKKAESMAGNATFPTISFKRQSDGQEIAVWTEDAKRFDLCLVHEGKKSFVNNQSKEEVEGILTRFQTESVTDICPKARGFWQRLFR
jgi:hypothetical protein